MITVHEFNPDTLECEYTYNEKYHYIQFNDHFIKWYENNDASIVTALYRVGMDDYKEIERSMSLRDYIDIYGYSIIEEYILDELI